MGMSPAEAGRLGGLATAGKYAGRKKLDKALYRNSAHYRCWWV